MKSKRFFSQTHEILNNITKTHYRCFIVVEYKM